MRRWLIPALLALAGLIAGAVLAAGGLYAAGFRDQGHHTYSLGVVLKPRITEGDQAAVAAFLDRLPSRGQVKATTKQQAYQEMIKVVPDSTLTADAMSARYDLTLTKFSCGSIAGLAQMNGVSLVLAAQLADGYKAGRRLNC